MIVYNKLTVKNADYQDHNATSFILCGCVCVSWGRGWGLGEMELLVGSNIMIHFLYILLFLIWHMYLYIIHC